MRSAQRRKRIEDGKKKHQLFGLFLKIIVPVVIILGAVLYIKLTTSYWNGQDKLGVAYKLPNDDVAVTVLDPKLSEVTTLIIPGETQVDVARNLGTMRIKNVWQLGINEKVGGILFSETITQNFLFPVFLWSDSDAESLDSGNVSQILRFIFIPKSTNISFGDRLQIGLFSMKLQEIERDNINLGKSQFLTKKKLNDGLPGYVLVGTPSPLLTVYFSDNVFANENLKVEITDATGSPGVADKVGQIVEIMGGKIVAVDKQTSDDKQSLPSDGKKPPSDTDCTVSGKDQSSARKIANIFSCKVEKGMGDFDVTISLGTAFAKRF